MSVLKSIVTSLKLVAIYVTVFFASILIFFALKNHEAFFLPLFILSILVAFTISSIILYLSLDNKYEVILTILLTFTLLFFTLFFLCIVFRSTIIDINNLSNPQSFDGKLTILIASYTNIIIETIYSMALFLIAIISVYLKKKHIEEENKATNIKTPHHSFIYHITLTILHYVHYISLFIYLFTFFNIVGEIITKSPLEASTNYIDFVQGFIILCAATPVYLITLVYRRYLLLAHDHYAHSMTRKLSRYSALVVLLFFGIILILLEHFNILPFHNDKKATLLLPLYIIFFIGIFAYYVYSAVVVNSRLIFHFFVAVMVGIVTIGVIYKAQTSFAYFPPTAIYNDNLRVNNLGYITKDIQLYTNEHNALPKTLDDLAPYNSSSVYSISDPRTNIVYDYAALDKDSYELCGVFETPLNFPVADDAPELRHTQGKHCFTFNTKTNSASTNTEFSLPAIITPIPTPFPR